jgi:predicted nuclease of predicted toxin-antitoxin system
MKFLVDAQLPAILSRFLQEAGHDCLHTADLPNGNRTTDAAILDLAESEGRIVLTKDSDFVNSHLLKNRPPSLVLISTGNISNENLLAIFRANLPALERFLATSVFLEIGRTTLIVHR